MKPYLLIILFLLFHTTFAQDASHQNNNSEIVWSPETSIKWDNFQGELDPNIIGSAMTIYSIEIAPIDVMVDENDMIQGYENLTCYAKFHKNLSWTVTDNQSVLKHEQLHFDIAEIFARKLRNKFEELKAQKDARFSSYTEAYNRIWKNCRQYQMQYDKLTDHGRNLEVNNTWQVKIEEELAKTKDL